MTRRRKERKREAVQAQPEQPIGAEAVIRQLAGMIFAAADTADDPRLSKLADCAMAIVMEEPATIRGLLVEAAKAQQQPQHRPANPFLDKMVRQHAASRPPANDDKFNALAEQILQRLNNEPGNRSTDPATDRSPEQQQQQQTLAQ